MIRYFMQFNDLKGATLPDTTQEFFFGAYGDNSDPGSAAGAGSNTAYLTPDTWYKLVYTYDGISARFYVNGVLNSTSPLSPISSIYSQFNEPGNRQEQRSLQ